jgi:ribosomal protein L34E
MKKVYSRCSDCYMRLPGVSLVKFSKTEKRPTRLFGGNLCHFCLRDRLKDMVRSGAYTA